MAHTGHGLGASVVWRTSPLSSLPYRLQPFGPRMNRNIPLDIPRMCVQRIGNVNTILVYVNTIQHLLEVWSGHPHRLHGLMLSNGLLLVLSDSSQLMATWAST